MRSFSELGVGEKVLKALTALGFENPTPIQEQAVPVLLSGEKDLVGLAQTGTGKTAAFGIPLIELVDFDDKNTQALVLAPTRELCVQITKDLASFSKFFSNANIVPVYGGSSIDTQIRAIKRGAQIVVATPGRLIDLIGRRAVKLETIRFVVLDEADEMLNMGFQEDIDEILSHTPKEKKVWLFSATMPSEVRRIAGNYMNKPFELTVGTKNSGAENIEHYYYVVHERDRYPSLKRILDGTPNIFGVVFCRTRNETQDVAEKLMKDGYNADALHGELSQQQRDKVMARYRNRSLQLLIATDVAARGIDVSDITHVINYNLPDEVENYTHRTGRTARAGKSGTAITLINIREMHKIRQIEKKIGRKFHLGKLPSAVEVVEMQLMGLIKKIHNTEVNEKAISKYMPSILEELKDLSKEEIIMRTVGLEFNRFLEYYRSAPDLNVDIAHQGRSANRERGIEGGDSYRASGPEMFINLGSADGFDKGSMLGYICDISGLKGADIGRISVKGVYSFIEIPEEKMQVAITAFSGEDYKGRKVRVDISTERSGKKSFHGGSGGGGGRKSYGDNGRSEDRGGDRGERRGGGGRGDRKSSSEKSWGKGDRKKSFKKSSW